MPRLVMALLAASASLFSGCAALTNPIADGIPVRRVPAEILGRPKADLRPIPLTALQQREPEPYRLDRGDVLAIVAPNLVGVENAIPPVKLPDQFSNLAALGYPFPVRDDGTISIPRLDPIQVRGLSVAEVETLVRQRATGVVGGQEVIVKGEDIVVQLYQRRVYRVNVVREDSDPVPLQVGTQVLGINRRGNGFALNLSAGENDVLRALNLTGGLPGNNARNEITILRNVRGNMPTDPNTLADPENRRQLVQNGDAVAVRIPLRLYPEQKLTVNEEDIILRDGDTVLIEARETEIFHTAGLLGGQQFILPRDYDLDVIQAIAQVRGPLLNGGFSQNAFIANAVGTGVGNPSPSLCTVLRIVGENKQIAIRVDLNRAFRDPRERILIQPGDFIVLQERPGEAIARYITQRTFLNSTFDLGRGVGSGILTSTNP